MRRLIVVVALLACSAPAIETRDTDNKKVTVDLLFTNDGCKIYRFEDNGRAHYYADCGGTATTRMEYHSNGKSSYTIPVIEDIPNARPK